MADPLTPGQIEDKTKLIKQGLYWEALDLRQESTTREVVLRIASLRQSTNNNEDFINLLNIVKRDLQSGNYLAGRLQVWEELFPKLTESVAVSVLNIDEEDISRETVWKECISENLSRMNGEVIKRVQAALTDRFIRAAVVLAMKAQEIAPSTQLTRQNVVRAIKALKKSIFCLRLAEAYTSNRQDIRHNLDIATKIELDLEQVARIYGYPIPTWPEQPSALVTPPPKKARAAAKPKPKPRPAAETPTGTIPLRKPKSKSVAITLAVFFGLWSWLYTYRKDKHKFWISFIITVSILVISDSVPGWVLPMWVPATWLWPIITAAVRPHGFYQEYPSVGATWLKKPTFVGVVIGSIVLFVLLPTLLGTTPSSDIGILGKAVDNPTLTWTTGGNAEWFSQTITHYYDGDAARSGAVTHSQSTWLRTSVTGPGTLTFYWRVSSESTHDFLGFYIDGVEQTSISGFVDWQQKAYSITSDTHTLEWRYTKDGSGTSISDCGWLDKVEFTSTATPTTPSSIILEDDFSNSSSGWYVGSNEYAELAYENGEYSVLQKEAGYQKFALAYNTTTQGDFPIEVGDFTIEVDVRDISGVSGTWAGITFRYTVAQCEGDYCPLNYYLFYVRPSDGAYKIWKVLRSEWTALTDWTESSYIKTGGDTNHLKVVCRGAQIEVYANGQKLITITDSSLTSGYVGVGVAAYEQANAHCHFDNFKLYAIEEQV